MKRTRTHKAKVYVGLSGGVDSSVSLALLQDQGYDVTGVFIKTWQPDFIECTWRDERRDAIRVCAALDVPFKTLDLEKEYKEGVADYMIEEYQKGRTPNPDVMCNREVKFGGFLKWALANGADYVATGHYARTLSIQRKVKKPKSKIINKELPPIEYRLKIGVDATKDQAYFLWTLTQEQLAHIIFPIGHLRKTEVRKLAEKYRLPTADKKDSQGVCFLGPLDMKDFLGHYLEHKEGDVLDEKGKGIGTHTGALFHTLGERHGFTITKKTDTETRYFIVAKDIKKNTITVSHTRPEKTAFAKKEFLIERTNWISEYPSFKEQYSAQIRYHGEYIPCRIKKIVSSTALVTFKTPQMISPGQSVVLYRGDVCIGGGIVAS